MPRIARVVLDGRPHHVTQRGVRSMKAFSAGKHYREYLRGLQKEARAKGLEVFSLCLMANHIAAGREGLRNRVYVPGVNSGINRGMTTSEMLMLMPCLIMGIIFAGYFGRTHHWLLGIVAFPLGFCSTLTVIGLCYEIWRRGGYYHGAKPTPYPVILRSLIVGSIVGVTAGLVFYYSAVRGIIPTVLGDSNVPGLEQAGVERAWEVASTARVSAACFGVSVSLTVVFLLLLLGERKRAITSRPRN